MRHPRRWRNVSLSFVAAGALSLLGAFVLPECAADDGARGLMGMFGLTALLLGGGNALFRHFDVRAKDALARGEEILARWRVDGDAWQAFLAYNHQLNQEDGVLPNELVVRDPAPAHGVEIIVGEQAVQVGESIHRLPRRGTPEVAHLVLSKGRVRPSFVEFLLYYPGGGRGASGVQTQSVRTALRFPVPLGAFADAERVVARYAAGRPGKADFFHGVGDGSDPEDLSTWLRPDVAISGVRFSGSPARAMVELGIMATVFVFGVTTMLYGAWQVRSGRRSVRVVAFLIGIVAVLGLVALMR